MDEWVEKNKNATENNFTSFAFVLINLKQDKEKERKKIKRDLQVAHLNLHEKFMSWDWSVYTTLSAEWNKSREKLKSTWELRADVVHGITWWSGKKLRKKQTTNLNSQLKHERKKFKIHVQLFCTQKAATATTERLNLSSPISPFSASTENFWCVHDLWI